jgi:hypothetical protein
VSKVIQALQDHTAGQLPVTLASWCVGHNKYEIHCKCFERLTGASVLLLEDDYMVPVTLYLSVCFDMNGPR